MIIDKIDHLSLYASIHPNIDTVIEFIKNNDINALSVGKHIIIEDEIYIVVSENLTMPIEQGIWEVHKYYIDIQCIVDGGEGIGCANPAKLVQTSCYDNSKDIQFFVGLGPVNYVAPGEFMLLMPGEAHASKIAVNGANVSRKVLFKVKV